MILSDTGIRRELLQRRLIIDPTPEDSQIQPASIDLTLDSWFAVPAKDKVFASEPFSPFAEVANQKNHVRPYHMADAEDYWWRFCLAPEASLLIKPGDFLLASTREVINLPAHLVGRVEGKSTPARWGLIVHTTAGFIDPGFEGPITLELVNVGPFAYYLHPGDSICQLSLEEVAPLPSVTYHGHYQHQHRPGLPV